MNVRAPLVMFAWLAFASQSVAASPVLYSQWSRVSQYVTVRDGTQLALDYYRPTVDGVAVEKPLPVILVATPYHRVERVDGKIVDFLTGASDHLLLAELLKHGYIIAVLDIRGRGASFGTVYGAAPESDQDRWDLFDIIEWLAAQSWSDGNIGMAGCSYLGRTQFLAAEVMPPHLRAIAPCGAGPDFYGLLRGNGIAQSVFFNAWDGDMFRRDVTEPAPAVDEDRSGELLMAAIAQHRISWDSGEAGMAKTLAHRPFRDTQPARAEFGYGAAADWNFIANFRVSRIPVLAYAGWRDFMPDQALAWYRSLEATGAAQHLIIGPWYHCGWYSSDLTDVVDEHLRWYDYWLKGVRNGVRTEPNVRYYTVGAPAGKEWHSSPQWPLRNEHAVRYYLHGGVGESLHGGTLGVGRPTGLQLKDDYRVDYTVSTRSMATRWHIPKALATDSHPGLKAISTDELDAKSITYTGPVLARDVEMTGSPVASLWVASTAADQDFFVYLEVVDAANHATLITEGSLRASNRIIRDAPFENGNLPWHPGFATDQQELKAGVPALIDLALYPTSVYLRAGQRLRLTISNADLGQWDTPVLSPPPTVSIFHEESHPSYVTLPFIR